MQKRIAKEEALIYEELLKKEINKDRSLHEKKPLKDKDDSGNQPPSSRCASTEPITITPQNCEAVN